VTESAGKTDWRSNGVRIVKAGALDLNTPQTPGMTRAAAINFAKAGAKKLWAGTVAVQPNAKTGAHHHGHLESIIYVVRGRATRRAAGMRSGAQRPGGGGGQPRDRAGGAARGGALDRPQPPAGVSAASAPRRLEELNQWGASFRATNEGPIGCDRRHAQVLGQCQIRAIGQRVPQLQRQLRRRGEVSASGSSTMSPSLMASNQRVNASCAPSRLSCWRVAFLTKAEATST
jgi:hypothetical protein